MAKTLDLVPIHMTRLKLHTCITIKIFLLKFDLFSIPCTLDLTFRVACLVFFFGIIKRLTF